MFWFDPLSWPNLFVVRVWMIFSNWFIVAGCSTISCVGFGSPVSDMISGKLNGR